MFFRAAATALLLAVGASSVVSADEQPVLFPSVAPPSAYVRMCSAVQTMSATELEKARFAYSSVSSQFTAADDVILAAARAHIDGMIDAHVVIRGYGGIVGGDGPDQRSSVVQYTRDGRTVYVLVRVTKVDAFVEVQPRSPSDVEALYLFGRSMAAFMLLNELLASDTVVPYVGCARAESLQGTSIPGITDHIERAMVAPEPADASSIARARAAYHVFAASVKARQNALTMATLHALGDAPAIAFVYRDVAHDSRVSEMDVVRLSRGSVRTYASMDVADGVARMSSPALCVVGDGRCAAYFIWP